MAIYVKIHKIDHSGINNNIALGQATKLRIKHTTLSDYVTIGNILDRIEYPTYYLYKVQSLGSNTADNFVKDYKVSASNVTPILLSSTTVLNSFNTISGNTLGFFNNTTGVYTIPQTSNVALTVSASITTSGSAGTGLFLIQSSGSGILSQKAITTGANVTTTISASYYPLGTDLLYFGITQTGNLTLKSGSFLITQSISPTASVSCSVIIEPYLTEPNYFNSDNNPLLNSVSDQRESTYALDVDYGYGTTPINFGLLVSGSATAATVPDSNYTIKKSIIPRYEGSKTTSQFLNKYTSGDQGTYDKLPSVESLRNAFIVAGWIGGWPPEIEGASAANINYIVREDGTLIKPWSTPNALSDLRNYFTDGENVTISSLENTGSTNQNYYKILKSGYRVQNILRTQKEGNPNSANFTSSISLEDINIGSGSGSGANIVEDYQGSISSWTPWVDFPSANNIFGTSNGNNTINEGQFYEVALPSFSSKGAYAQYSSSLLARRYPGTGNVSSSRYQVTQAIIEDKVTLNFNMGLWATYWPRPSDFHLYTTIIPWNPESIRITYQVVKLRDGVEETLFTSQPAEIVTEENRNQLNVLKENAEVNESYQVGGYYNSHTVYISAASTRKKYAKQQALIEKGPDYPGLKTHDFSVPYTKLRANDQIYLKVKVDATGLNQPQTFTGVQMQRILLNAYFDTWQSPAPSGTVNTSNFWISASSFSTQNITKQMINSSSYNPYDGSFTDYETTGSSVFPLFDGDNILFTTSSLFVNNFGNKYAKAVDILPLNGFDPITLPFKIKRGDEFKFEGNEDQIYVVRKAAPLSCSGGFILAVELDKPLPTSGSLNYSNFSIKRYSDFEGQLIFKGTKPTPDGPFIITPEFITQKLSNNMNNILTDMTAKGLL